MLTLQLQPVPGQLHVHWVTGMILRKSAHIAENVYRFHGCTAG